jgi:hypothetical protein
MSNPFFDHPILNSPYARPERHWELDEEGQPTQKIVEARRRAEFITPIPKPKKRKRVRHDAKPHRGRLRGIRLRGAGDLHTGRVVGGLSMGKPNDRVHDDVADEIVEDIRAVRHAHAAAFGFDIIRIVADLRQRDAASGDPLVSLPPKPGRHRRAGPAE